MKYKIILQGEKTEITFIVHKKEFEEIENILWRDKKVTRQTF